MTGRRCVELFSLFVGLIILLEPTIAQEPIVITMTASPSRANLYEQTVIPAFEDEHPHIQVEFIYTENRYFTEDLAQSQGQLEEQYQYLATYAASADVLEIDRLSFTPFVTNTGFFLDLSPLVTIERDLMPEDFHPAAWEAFQWDGGIWALPYSLSVELLVYNRSRFDMANLPYPNENWQFMDFIQAAESLHTYNTEGEVEFSPLEGLSPLRLMAGSLGPTYEVSTTLAEPMLTDPAVVNLLATYTEYLQAHDFAENGSPALWERPFYIGWPFHLQVSNFQSSQASDWSVSLLPGGYGDVNVNAFAISSGTANPEAAYELASFMTRNIDLIYYGPGQQPARQSLNDIEVLQSRIYQPPRFDPEVQLVMDAALANPVSSSNYRSALGFDYSVDLVITQNMDPINALMQAENRIRDVLTLAESQSNMQITVAPVEMRQAPEAGEIVLQFGVNTQFTMDRRNLWQDAIDAFVEANPNIIDVDIQEGIYDLAGRRDETLDCWYDPLASNVMTGPNPPIEYLALNPLINADPTFYPQDFLPGVLEIAQIQDVAYGYPVTVDPILMWINPSKFEEAGLPLPQGTWTINDFTNALEVLADQRDNQEQPVLDPSLYGYRTHLMLLSAYGAEMIDFDMEPPTYNLTDPETINALEQLSVYVRSGIIGYRDMFGLSSLLVDIAPSNQFIATGSLTLGPGGSPNQWRDYPLQVVSFPTGNGIPIDYTVGMMHINRETLYPEACYEWMRMIGNRPELFDGMPATYTALNNPVTLIQQGEEVVAFYQTLVDQMLAVGRPQYSISSNSYPGAWIETDILRYALNEMFIHDANVAVEAAEATENIQFYRSCADGIESLTQQEIIAQRETNPDFDFEYARQFVDCGISAVPELRQIYSFLYEG